MKINIVSPPPQKYGGTFFLKKLCLGGGQTFLRKLVGGAVLHED